MKTIKSYLIVAILVLLAIILISNKLIIWGIGVLTAALIILGIQQLIRLNVKVSLFEDNIKNLDEKNNALQTQNKKLAEENSFLKERHFQITQIKSILELNLFEIDTKFTRSIINQEKLNDKNIKYFGSLSISLKAKYGIDCKELRFKYDQENNVLKVANINPKFLSFGNRKLEWDFFEIYEYRGQNILADKKWMTSDDLYKYADTLKEKYRVSIENSLESGPEEFTWIHTPIKQNVENVIRILFSGLCPNIRVVEEADASFIQIDNLSFDSLAEQKKLTE
jgi:cell division protein FtsB